MRTTDPHIRDSDFVRTLLMSLIARSAFCYQVGIGLNGVIIASMVVSGPAYNCGLLNIGDRILSVNGVAVHGCQDPTATTAQASTTLKCEYGLSRQLRNRNS